MATIHKMVVYIVDIEDQGLMTADVQDVLENGIDTVVVRVTDPQERDLEIDEDDLFDDQPLILTTALDADFERYFI